MLDLLMLKTGCDSWYL